MLKAQNQEINLTILEIMRHQPNGISIQHKHLRDQIKILRQQNQKLKKRLQKMEDAMHQIYISKKKYKNRYKQIKQKLDILQQVYKNSNQQNNNLYKNRQYQQGHNFGNIHYQGQNQFSKKNEISNIRRQDLTSKALHMKQDLTANTLHTMPSSRKSQSKDFFRKNYQSRNMKESNTSNSQIKDVGKIFSFKSQQRARYHSSGSQLQNQRKNGVYGNGVYGHSILRNQKQRSQKSPTNYQTTTQYIQQNGGSLKQLIEHLINQLHSFSKLQHEQNNLEKQVQLIQTQALLSQKLQEVCQKLHKIESNQQALIVRISEREQKIVDSGDRNRSKKGTNLTTGSRSKLNTSFLKTIEDIGKDLTQWKVDYVSAKR